MLKVSDELSIPLTEIRIDAIRAAGPGGQNVNKVSSAVHLRFDVRASAAIPDELKVRLLAWPDRRISADGIIVIKSQRFRSQEKNREDALGKLAELINRAAARKKPRIPTRPGASAKQRRLNQKTKRGKVKKLRQAPPDRE